LVVSGGIANTAPSEFDYEALPPDVASHARQAAERIRGLIGKQQKAIVETGLELRAMKKELQGRFLKWIEDEFGMSDKTAERYMRVASYFGTRIDTVSNLSPTTLYKLTERSTPDQARVEVLTLLDSGQPISDSEVHTRIAAAKTQRRQGAVDQGKQAGRRDRAKQAAEILAKLDGGDLDRLVELRRDLTLAEIPAHVTTIPRQDKPNPVAALPLPMAELWESGESSAEKS
jgi:hypothetical protein